MPLSKTPQSFCMSLKTIQRRSTGDTKTDLRILNKKSTNFNVKISPRRQIDELIFENCFDCGRMSAVPQGAFAACKVRENQERVWLISEMNTKDRGNENKGNNQSYNNKPINQSTELTPLKYNSKLMNSIWGLYNRYSVHNFKKNTDANGEGLLAGWRAAIAPIAPQNPAMATADKPRALIP